MAFSDMRASIGTFSFVFGLCLASFSLFLHPMDPLDFLAQALSGPQARVAPLYGQVQGVMFWISAACMIAGLLGMLWSGLRRWRAGYSARRLQANQADFNEGEENWMFL